MQNVATNKLNITETRRRYNVEDALLFVILTIAYTIAHNSQYSTYALLRYSVIFVELGFLLFLILKKRFLKIDFFTIWCVLYFFYSLISVFWCKNLSISLDMIQTLLLMYLTLILTTCVIDNARRMNLILFSNLIALFLLAIYIVNNIDLTTLGDERIGADSLNTVWNANNIGIKLCIGVGIAIYFLFQSKNLIFKIFSLGSGIFMGYITLFTGSRTALLMLLLIVFMFIILSSKRYRLLAIIIAVTAVVALYFFIMNNELLYNVLGSRMEDMIEGLFGGRTNEGSFNERSHMIELGFKWFLEKPFFGYGVNSYRSLYLLEMGWETYSHNNFIEMLVNGGIVGFIIYYSIYAYVIVKLIRALRKDRSLTIVLLSTLVVSTLILQISLISYYGTIYNLILMLAVNQLARVKA